MGIDGGLECQATQNFQIGKLVVKENHISVSKYEIMMTMNGLIRSKMFDLLQHLD